MSVTQQYQKAYDDMVARTVHVINIGHYLDLEYEDPGYAEVEYDWVFDVYENAVRVSIAFPDPYESGDSYHQLTLPIRLYTATDKEIESYWQDLEKVTEHRCKLEDLTTLVANVWHSKEEVLNILQSVEDGVDYSVYEERRKLAKSLVGLNEE